MLMNAQECYTENLQELIELFVNEGSERLDDAENSLSTLKNEYDDQGIDIIAGAFHAIKGSAAFLNFEAIVKTAHEAENLLALLRSNKRNPSSVEIHLLYQTSGLIRQLLSAAGQTGQDTGFEHLINFIISTIRACLENDITKIPSHTNGSSDSIIPETIDTDISESLDLLDRAEAGILLLAKNPSDMKTIYDIHQCIDTLASNGEFLHYARIEEAIAELKSFLDILQSRASAPMDNLNSFLLHIIDAIRDRVIRLLDNARPIPLPCIPDVMTAAMIPAGDQHTISDTIPKTEGFSMEKTRQMNTYENQNDLFLVDDEENTQADKYLLFNLGSVVYGIDIIHVTEIIELQKITAVPDMPNHVTGVINLRGKVLPVVNLRLRLAMQERNYDDRTCIIICAIGPVTVGFIVDSVAEVQEIPEKNIQPPPRFGNTPGHERFINGLGKVGDDVKVLLDVSWLLKEKEIISPEAITNNTIPTEEHHV